MNIQDISIPRGAEFNKIVEFDQDIDSVTSAALSIRNQFLAEGETDASVIARSDLTTTAVPIDARHIRFVIPYTVIRTLFRESYVYDVWVVTAAGAPVQATRGVLKIGDHATYSP
jgi:hypothetical protein